MSTVQKKVIFNFKKKNSLESTEYPYPPYPPRWKKRGGGQEVRGLKLLDRWGSDLSTMSHFNNRG